MYREETDIDEPPQELNRYSNPLTGGVNQMLLFDLEGIIDYRLHIRSVFSDLGDLGAAKLHFVSSQYFLHFEYVITTEINF